MVTVGVEFDKSLGFDYKDCGCMSVVPSGSKSIMDVSPLGRIYIPSHADILSFEISSGLQLVN
tara:strand:- start:113 stop:301 length:189 start_codon:yes stop_codon:yes gene_type:complete